MAVAHREDGGAAGMSGRRVAGAVEEQSTPVSACREEGGCEEEGCREGAGGAPKSGNSPSAGGGHQASGKRLSGRFHFFLEVKINK